MVESGIQPTIWLRVSLPSEWNQRLRAAYPDCVFLEGPDQSISAERLPEVDGLITDRPLSRDVFLQLTSLRWLQTTWAAAYHLYRPFEAELMQRSVDVSTGRGLHGETFSEFGLACIFALAKQLDLCVRAQTERRWAQAELTPRRLSGKTLGIVGLGTVGHELARKAHALGLRVIATRRSPEEKPPYVAELWLADGLNRLLQQADFVVLSLPDIAETIHFLGEPELRLLKPSAYLINLAPKEAIAEDVLVRALRERWFAGAALDALPREPLPPESELWTLSNVLISPRAAGRAHPDDTDRYWEEVFALLHENVGHFLRGETLRNQIDRARGY